MKTVSCHIPSMLDAAALSGFMPDETALAGLNDPCVEAIDLSKASDHLHLVRDEHRQDPEQISKIIARCFPAYEEGVVQAIAYRLNALYVLLNDHALSPWVMLDKKARVATIKLQVLEAAIAVPLSMQEYLDGLNRYLYIGFDRGAFLTEVLRFDDTDIANVA